MTESQKTKKISRRDAIKLLGAVTGATVLANLPSKWSTPEIAQGILPAHAQTSISDLFIQSCNLSVDLSTGAWSSTVFTGPVPFIGTRVVQYTLTFVNMFFTSDAPGPQTPNPVISNRNLDSNGQETIDHTQTGFQGLDTLAIDSTATSGSFTVFWEFLSPSHGTGTCSQTFNWALPTVETTSIIDSNGIQSPAQATFIGQVTNIGSSPVTQRGFEWSVNPTMTPILGFVPLGAGGVGAFSISDIGFAPGDYYGRAYATNSVGTAYGATLLFQPQQCLVEGTIITLADGTQKKIEEINYSDSLLVWNFDDGHFDAAQALWIKKAETAYQYNLLEFSDGTVLKTVRGHRILNIEKGMFTYPHAEETPLETTTFNANGEKITLIKKSVVNEQVNFYNVITHKHMNLFANGLLTSCRYNNIYPIADMKFVKDERALRSQAEYDVGEKYYEGLRLAEQTLPVVDTIAYINRLELHKAQPQDLVKFEPELVI